MGKLLVHRDVWWNAICSCGVILQARYEVRFDHLVFTLLYDRVLTIFRMNSIHTWALKEAKRRMEEKGESVEYKPS